MTIILLPAQLPAWPHHVDYGVLLVLGGLFLATILAHRYWRAKIDLEDRLAAQRLDTERAQDRYRLAFRAMAHPAAFVDRNTGLVMESTPGWTEEGLPEAGELVFLGDAALETAWRAIQPPDPGHRPAPAVDVRIGDRAFLVRPLEGPSLGVILVVQR